MQIIYNKNELVRILGDFRKQGKTIGFVPTMGALHAGHLSLIGASKKHCDITVCSIFVNPTQFNDKADLEKYPRMPKEDTQMLESAGCDILFMPDEKEVYDGQITKTFDFKGLDRVLEGLHRPGHFNGVAQVVSILFDIVKPNKAFFGQKDYQQLLIIKSLEHQLKLNIEIVACPTMREADGLAMSSRNMRLSDEERKAASLIPKLMKEAKAMMEKGKTVNEISSHVKEQLKDPIYKLDYFAICDSVTLKEFSGSDPNSKPMALIACFVGKIRLIDNLFLG